MDHARQTHADLQAITTAEETVIRDIERAAAHWPPPPNTPQTTGHQAAPHEET